MAFPSSKEKRSLVNYTQQLEVYCSQPKKIAKRGATLLSVRAPVGPTNLTQSECCIGRGLAALHPCGGIEPKFLLYLFKSIEPEFSRQGTGSTFNAVTKGFIENLEFDLPPLPEQNRIVSKIEELFSELDKGIENLKNAREQIEGILVRFYSRTPLKAISQHNGVKRIKASLRSLSTCSLVSSGNGRYDTNNYSTNGGLQLRNWKKATGLAKRFV